MSDYQLTSGPLRSAITIELHTHRATQLWQGRRGSIEDKVHPIIGMPRFLVIMNTIKMDAARNNPYADMWMLQLEERLLEARTEMNELLHEAEKALVAIPDTINIESCLSIQPAKFPLFVSAQLGYIAIYLLTDFDQLARKMMLANHMAVCSSTYTKDFLERASGMIRSIYSLAQKYQRVPVTRQDFIDGHRRAKDAEEHYGPVPVDILNATRRSQYAPPILRTTLTSAEEENTAGTPDEIATSVVEAITGNQPAPIRQRRAKIDTTPPENNEAAK